MAFKLIRGQLWMHRNVRCVVKSQPFLNWPCKLTLVKNISMSEEEVVVLGSLSMCGGTLDDE